MVARRAGLEDEAVKKQVKLHGDEIIVTDRTYEMPLSDSPPEWISLETKVEYHLIGIQDGVAHYKATRITSR